MAISLKKGEGVNLSKEVKELQNVTVGLGWSASTSGATIDCDSFVYALREIKTQPEKKGFLSGFFKKNEEPETRLCIMRNDDIVYYGHLTHSSGCIVHHGDDLVGGAKGDCETISINLSKMPGDIKCLVIGINIYSAFSKGQDFGMIRNCFGRIVDDATKREICRYDLSNDYGRYTAVIIGQFMRRDDGWYFEALGKGKTVRDIMELAKEYR